MTGIDATAVNLILAPLATQLHIAITRLQWVMNVYLLVYAVLVVVGGRLGDSYGQKTILITGLVGFSAGSFFAAFAHSLMFVLIGRVIQGVGAAFISPNAMALVYSTFPIEKKGVATGILTSALGAAIALGPLFGGLLTRIYSWRLVFLINLPLSILAIILITIIVKARVAKPKSIMQLDLPGAAVFGLFPFPQGRS